MISYRTLGYEYPDKEAAGEAFNRAYAELRDLSVWRTATPDLDRWFIIAILGAACDDSSFDWGGEEIEVSEEQRDWMIRRRLGRRLQAALEGETGHVKERNHYEPETAPVIPGGSQ